MANQEEHKHKEDKSLEAISKLEHILDILEELTSIFDNLEDPHKLCQLNQFVEPSNPCQSHHIIHARTSTSSEDYFEWKDRQEINEEPGLKVTFRNGRSIIDDSKVLVSVCCCETKYHIQKEKHIYDVINYRRPLLIVTLLRLEGDTVWSDDTCNDQENSEPEIPVSLDLVLRIEHKFLSVVTFLHSLHHLYLMLRHFFQFHNNCISICNWHFVIENIMFFMFTRGAVR